MSENKFLNNVLTEGVLFLILGVLMFVLPKLTTITFGMMLCLAFIIYGGYKVINSIMTRNYTKHFVYDAFVGLFLFVLGIVLFFMPMFNLLLITSLIAVFFMLESISSFAFGLQNKNTLMFWQWIILVSAFQFFLGLMILLGLPSSALWVIGVLAGINFLAIGLAFVGVYIATKYSETF